MVLTIASTLKTKHDSDEEIEILAESTDYQKYDVEYTRNRKWASKSDEEKKKRLESKVGLPIVILKDLEAIKMIDQNTLVFCNLTADGYNLIRDRRAPVCDILADSFDQSRLPAAIFEPIVYQDKNDAETYQKHKCLATPRVVKMLNDYMTCEIGKFKVSPEEANELGYPLWFMNLYWKKREDRS